eukprot:GGOE01044133.1.p1 GENE.GGOE01044133.1~~GGOE01044133.1.p1  ORF type:complete len:185 (-),score=36.95 GGOE01044133.1:274-771(-)
MAENGHYVLANSGRVTVEVGRTGARTAKVVAAQPFAAGAVIGTLNPHVPADKQTYLTLQVSPSEHILLNNEIQYVNHSCAPTAFMDVERLEIVALKDLQEGEEITAFYPAFEWSMSEPFDCWCGAPKCLKRVRGAKYIPHAVLESYVLNTHIKAIKAAQGAELEG